MKSLTLVAALAVTLTFVPRAEAKPAQGGGTIRGVKATLTQLISRYLSKFRVEDDYPTDPWPRERDLSGTTTTTTELSPKRAK
jgi:hypothetical protein